MGVLRDRLGLDRRSSQSPFDGNAGGRGARPACGGRIAGQAGRHRARSTPADLVAALAHAALGDDDPTGPSLSQTRPRVSRPRPVARRARLGRGLSRRASPIAADPGGGSAPDPRLLGRQPRRRPEGRRPGRARVLGLLARHRPSPRARRRQRRLLVSPGRQASGLQPLAEAARPLLDEHGDNAARRPLDPGGAWNATAMIDLCTAGHGRDAARRPGAPAPAPGDVALARGDVRGDRAG